MTETTLKCPCGSDLVHHDSVEVFERTEDADAGVRVRVSGVDVGWRNEKPPDRCPAAVRVDTSLDGNPSARRQGIAIHFWCEECRGRFVLTIAQHKGMTLLDVVSAKTASTISVEPASPP